MTLREEVLKNSGLLTEMAAVRKIPFMVYFFNFQFEVINNATTLSINGNFLPSSAVYKYIMGSTAVKNVKKFDMEYPEDNPFYVLVNYNGEEDMDNSFYDIDAKNIIKHIISLSGQKKRILEFTENMILDLKKENNEDFKEWLESWIKIKSFIEKEC